jgi:lipoprotein-anchoring transpeptidase ErfK/SrfK
VNGHRTILASRQHLSAGKSNFRGNTAFSSGVWRVAVLTAGVFSTASSVEAATYYWPDYYEPAPSYRAAPPRITRSRKPRLPKTDDVAKDARKPQGPLIIAISIEKQVLKVYDANGYFAETPISTGMRGHSTPMGVFSVIQKHKYHRSNIYSAAPMPYMQRITWSGVAMHAGVLPGYPASHGCIRMPMNFAVKMWGWTRMGARVVITPGELAPESFSHPLLATQKTAPAPVASADPPKDFATTAKSDKAALAETAEAGFELKSTVGHDLAKATAGDNAAPATLREQTHTADASSALSQPRSPLTISDLIAGGRASAEKKPDAPNSVEVTASDDTKSAEAASAEIKPAETDAFKSPDASAAMDGTAKSEFPAVEPTKADDAKPETAKAETAAVADVKADTPSEPKAVDKPEQSAKAAPDVSADVPALNKDQARPSDADKAGASKPEPSVLPVPKRGSQIAVFVSRKDSKLYVRQNFAPLFDVPVTIAPGDRPLGTHVFTAQADKEDANLLHWSVVSMPLVARMAALHDDDERASRRRKTTGAIEVKPVPLPDSAAEALDRLTIPADAMARINEALSTGASIIVSDQGINTGETGEGTDFIIPLR